MQKLHTLTKNTITATIRPCPNWSVGLRIHSLIGLWGLVYGKASIIFHSCPFALDLTWQWAKEYRLDVEREGSTASPSRSDAANLLSRI